MELKYNSTLGEIVKPNDEPATQSEIFEWMLENPGREDIIAKNRDYIVSNWGFIKNQEHPLFKGCSMV